MRLRAFAIVVAGLLGAACSGSGGGGGPDAAGGGGPDAATDGFTTLLSSPWTVTTTGDFYWCERLTVDHDLYISAFEAIAPPGTHHTVLTVGPPNGPDGGSPCDVGTLADAMIFGSGVGTNSLTLPTGVAMKVAAGQQLLLNLHLFNTTGGTLTGTSGTKVKLVDAAAVQQQAEVILAGRVPTLAVPPGDVDQVGSCVMNGDVHIFEVGPHMHKKGVHMKVTAQTDAGEVTLHDGAYTFGEQKIYPVDDVQLKAGQTVTITCSYHNDGATTLHFGESSNDEMCFAGLYRYPAFGGNAGIICATN